MNTSPTRLEVFNLCARKWWFIYVKKLLTIPKHHFDFGTLLHAAIERFLKGQEVWPEGWSKDLPPAEAALIQVLVQEAIDNGIVERRPDGEVEREVILKVTDEVTLYGKVDYYSFSQARIEDHKHSKKEKYLLSPKKLATNIQMLCYAVWLLKEYEKKGQMPPRIVTLCHNQFVKDFEKPKTRRREAELTPAQIEKFWNDVVLEIVAAMKIEATKQDPFDIADPPPSACNAYGGCDFVTICGGQETIPEYNRRIRLMTEEAQMPEEISPEDFLNRRKKKKTSVAVNPPPDDGDDNDDVTEVAKPAAKKNPESVPPWTNPECNLCSKLDFPGFNRSGKPCRICIAVTQISTEGYEWHVDDGQITWWEKGAKVATVDGPAVTAGGTKTAFAVDDFLNKIKKAADDDQLENIVEEAKSVLDKEDMKVVVSAAMKRLEQLSEPEPEPEPKQPPPAKKESKPKPAPKGEEEKKIEGLTLLIGCAPLKWQGTCVFAEDVLRKVEGYWSNTAAFERREQVRKTILAGGDLIQSLENVTIIQQGRDPDIDNLMSSLLPFADNVIRGTIQ